MRSGGFDAVVGNPPYFSVDATWGANDSRARYLSRTYPDVYVDKTDILFYFLARAGQISKGEVGFIVSRSMLEAYKAQGLRAHLSQHLRVREVLDLRHALVFPGVGINTAILRLTKARRVGDPRVRRLVPRQLPPGTDALILAADDLFEVLDVPQRRFTASSWNFAEQDVHELLQRMDTIGTPVDQVLHVGQGMQTGSNAAFAVADGDVPKGPSASRYYRRRARNSDIRSYNLRIRGQWLIYPEAAARFEDLPPVVRDHLARHRTRLEQRAAYRRGNCEWWRYTWPLHKQHADSSRIFSPYMSDRNNFALDERAEFIGLTDTTVLYDKGQPEDLRYVLAFLNSAALTLRFRYIGKLKGGGVYEYFDNTVGQLPIPRARPGEAIHDALVALVRRRERLGEEQALAVALDSEAIQRDLAAVEEQIEGLVCQAFGLSNEDRAYIQRTVCG